MEQRVRNGQLKVADVEENHCVVAPVSDSVESIDYVALVPPLIFVCFSFYIWTVLHSTFYDLGFSRVCGLVYVVVLTCPFFILTVGII